MHGTVRRTNQRIRSKRMRLTDQSPSERGIRKGRFSPGYKTGNTKGASVNQGLELRHTIPTVGMNEEFSQTKTSYNA